MTSFQDAPDEAIEADEAKEIRSTTCEFFSELSSDLLSVFLPLFLLSLFVVQQYF